MPSLKNLKNLQAVTRFCYSLTFTQFPLTYRKNSQIFQIVEEKSMLCKPLLFLNIFNYITVTAQFIFNLSTFSLSNLVPLLFRGFVFFFTSATWIYCLGYHSQSTDFCILMNCLEKNPGGLLHKDKLGFRKSENFIYFLIILSQTATVFAFLVFIPTVDILITVCLSDLSFVQTILAILSVMLKLPSFVSACAICVMTISIWFTVVDELGNNLKTFFYVQVKCCKYARYINQCLPIKTYYRQYQIFGILVNRCFEFHFWPVFQVASAITCIGILYALLTYQKVLTSSISICLLLMLLNCFLVNYFLFGTGSQSLVFSKKIICRSNVLVLDDQKWLKKFVKSCSPICLRVGSFHKMDTERWPLFLRFVLQRTFFLVVKSRV